MVDNGRQLYIACIAYNFLCRPLAMRKDGIQTRKRKPKSQQKGSQKDEIKTEGEDQIFIISICNSLQEIKSDNYSLDLRIQPNLQSWAFLEIVSIEWLAFLAT